MIEALREYDEGPVEIVSDSSYVVKCFHDQWYVGWRRRNWKNSQGKPVANRDLWEALFALTVDAARDVTFSWVKGHSGDPMNDFVDLLATRRPTVRRRALLGPPRPRRRRNIRIPLRFISRIEWRDRPWPRGPAVRCRRTSEVVPAATPPPSTGRPRG